MTKTKQVLIISLLCVIAGLFSVLFAIKTFNVGADEIVYANSAILKNESDTDILGVKETPSFFSVKDSGVMVNHHSDGAKVKTAHPIDIRSFTLNEDLVTFYFAPAVKGISDYRGYLIRVTDYYDENNYFEVKYMDDPRSEAYGYYISVATQNTTGYVSVRSFFQYGVFGGVDQRDAFNSVSTPIGLAFDYAHNKVYHMTHGSSERFLLADLTNSELVGLGNEWKGFSGGLVNITMSPYDVKVYDAKVLIKSIAGVDLGVNGAIDDNAPTLYTAADTRADILTAAVGREYKIFSCEAYDVTEGVLSDKVRVSIEDEKGNSIAITNGAITPQTAGVYKIVFSVSDSAGNSVSKSYSLKVVTVAPAVSVSTSTSIKTEISVGETLILPDAEISGGVGEKTLKISARNIYTNETEFLTDGKFTAYVSGEFEIVYEATDYLGTVKAFSVLINVLRGDKPIGEFPALPETLISGKKIKLPQMIAYDYVTNPAACLAANISVRGYFNPDKSDAFVIDNYKFTPVLGDGETKKTLYLEYSAALIGDETKKIVKTYNVNVVKADKLREYFFVKEGDITASTTDRGVSYIAFDTTAGGTMQYANALAADDFEFMFTVPKDEGAGITSVSLKLTDIYNPQESLKIKLSPSGSKTSFEFQNVEYSMTGQFYSKDQISLKLDLFNKKFDCRTESGYKKVASISAFDNGLKFNGFSSDRVYAEISVETNGTASVIKLVSIGGQNLSSNISGDEELPFDSNIITKIVVDGEIASSVKKNEKITVYTAHAYNAIETYIECYVSVIAPNGTTGKTELAQKVLIEDDSFTFVADAYGTYRIRYQAIDCRNKKTTAEFSIKVTDRTPPVIWLNEKVPEKAKVGNTVNLPTANVYDEVSAKPTLKVFVVYDFVITEITENLKFVPTEKGEYTIRYYAYDAEYNSFYLDYKVIVE